MTSENSALTAHKQSIANAMAGNKEAWLALFDENAVIHDPVGRSAHDPEAKGFCGREEHERFWDMMIGPSNLELVPKMRIPCGPLHCAVHMESTNRIGEKATVMDMIAVYEVNDAGKLISLNVYWDAEALNEQFKKLGFI